MIPINFRRSDHEQVRKTILRCVADFHSARILRIEAGQGRHRQFIRGEFLKKQRTCSVEGCENKHYGLGYCKKHYDQMQRNGRIIDGELKAKKNKKCDIDNCNEKVYGRGYCHKHWKQKRKEGKLPGSKQCSVENCKSFVTSR